MLFRCGGANNYLIICIFHFCGICNKVDSAAEKILAVNPEVTVKKYHAIACAANIGQIVDGYNFVIDGTDNFVAKFLINDACVLKGKPYSRGGGLRFDGQTMTVIPGKSACYRCIFPSPPPQGVIPRCSKAGILSSQSLAFTKSKFLDSFH